MDVGIGPFAGDFDGVEETDVPLVGGAEAEIKDGGEEAEIRRHWRRRRRMGDSFARTPRSAAAACQETVFQFGFCQKSQTAYQKAR